MLGNRPNSHINLPHPSAHSRPGTLTPAGGTGRIFAALQCGNDHVAFEAARLLTRLFAPAAARAGAGPWQMSKAGLGDAGGCHCGHLEGCEMGDASTLPCCAVL